MADDINQDTEEIKKKSPMLVLGVVGAIMLLEGAAVVMVMKMTAGPKSAGAAMVGQDADANNETVEVELINTRFQNLTTNRVWDWEVEIHLKVLTKDAARVTQVLDRRNAEIRDGIATIFRRAPHAQLKDPERRTIVTQVHALLDEIIGRSETDSSLIARVLVPTCDGYPADF